MPKAKAQTKAKAQKAQDKSRTEQKKKVVEDKTFGLKNKNKSAKVQKFIQNQYNTIDPRQNKGKTVEDKKEKKKLEAERQKELDDLFKVAIKQPKVPLGVDPKSILCEHFRHGCCTKSFKCKFSHDLNIERKAEKIDLYTDRRDGEDMENWDQDTLEKVVEQKHGDDNKKTNSTSIICKFFLDAVEKKQFWKCPNGNECRYRHALPPGYVLKSQMTELLEEAAVEKVDVSETIEAERQKVEAKTPITEEVFNAWHGEKTKVKEAIKQKETEERLRRGNLNGRELFLQAGFEASDDASATVSYARENDVEEEIRQMEQETKKQAEEATKTSRPGGGVPGTHLNLDAEHMKLFTLDDCDSEPDDDHMAEDDLDPEELRQLEAELESGLKLDGDEAEAL